MSRLADLLSIHWMAVVFLTAALVAGGGIALLRQRRGTLSYRLIFLASTLGLFGVGGLALPSPWWGFLLVGAALAAFSVTLFVLVLSGRWWAPLGYGLGAVLLLGLGGLVAQPLSEGLLDAFDVALSLRALQ